MKNLKTHLFVQKKLFFGIISRIVYVLSLSLISFIAFSQELEWLHKINTSFNFSQTITTCRAIRTDTQGNIYFAGSIRGNSHNFAGATLNASGTENNIFLAKYNSQGGFIWAKVIGANGSDFCLSDEPPRRRYYR